jgi:hypothetical protein
VTDADAPSSAWSNTTPARRSPALESRRGRWQPWWVESHALRSAPCRADRRPRLGATRPSRCQRRGSDDGAAARLERNGRYRGYAVGRGAVLEVAAMVSCGGDQRPPSGRTTTRTPPLLSPPSTWSRSRPCSGDGRVFRRGSSGPGAAVVIGLVVSTLLGVVFTTRPDGFTPDLVLLYVMNGMPPAMLGAVAAACHGYWTHARTHERRPCTSRGHSGAPGGPVGPVWGRLGRTGQTRHM